MSEGSERAVGVISLVRLRLTVRTAMMRMIRKTWKKISVLDLKLKGDSYVFATELTEGPS